MNSTPGCSLDEAYINRKMDWPTEEDALSWTSAVPEPEREKIKELGNKEHRFNISNKMLSQTYNVSKERRNSPNVSYYKNTNSRVSSQYSPYNKGINIMENRQLVPPSAPSSADEEGEKIGRKGKNYYETNRMESDKAVVPVTPSAKSDNRSISGRVSAIKTGKSLIKPAVVTITSKEGGATYAEILRSAREKVSLRDLGIENTIIRRATNGAIIITVPGPQGRQLASSLSSNLAKALGESVKVANPVEVGELRVRGIDPSVTKEEIHEALAAMSGSPQQDLKISAINFMRDGMGVAWVKCPIETAVKLAEISTGNKRGRPTRKKDKKDDRKILRRMDEQGGWRVKLSYNTNTYQSQL